MTFGKYPVRCIRISWAVPEFACATASTAGINAAVAKRVVIAIFFIFLTISNNALSTYAHVFTGQIGRGYGWSGLGGWPFDLLLGTVRDRRLIRPR